jgi:hypothetical protein
MRQGPPGVSRALACGALAAVVFVVSAAAPSPSEAARGLKTGLWEVRHQSSNEEERADWFDRTADAGAGFIRLNVPWGGVAPTEPSDARDPADPAYGFAALDAAVKDAGARRLDVLFLTFRAPSWAEGKNRPENADAGTWKPNPSAFGDFGTALATRYSGQYPDPNGPGLLPRVKYFEAWNEPNLPQYITPQFKGKKSKAPAHYRKLLNAFYDAVHDVKASNQVVGPGTSPFGDDPGGNRHKPLRFMREVFCLTGQKSPKAKNNCKTKDLPKLDIVSHHPIAAWGGGPQNKAFTNDDITTADLERVVKVMRTAEKAGNVLPKQGKKSKRRKLWVTEFFYFSNPPLMGVPFTEKLAKHARFIEESLFVFWKDGASAALYYGLGDTVSSFSNPDPFSSGLYFDDGTPKPALTAFRFPFVTERDSAKKIMVWGKAPVTGKLKVQEKRSSGWKTIKRINVKKGKVFYKKAPLKGKAKLRGLLEGETSRTWTQKA